eukprot:1955661-Alexandrium_andersonii.AAC.1
MGRTPGWAAPPFRARNGTRCSSRSTYSSSSAATRRPSGLGGTTWHGTWRATRTPIATQRGPSSPSSAPSASLCRFCGRQGPPCWACRRPRRGTSGARPFPRAPGAPSALLLPGPHLGEPGVAG